MPVTKTVFKNSFEITTTPFGWSNAATAGVGSSIGVETKRPHHGAYNGQSTLGANLGAGQFSYFEYIGMNNAYRHLSMRVMNAHVSVLPEDNTDYFRLIAYANASGGASIICAYGMIKTAGSVFWYMRSRNAAAFTDQVAAVSPVANQLYCLEAEILQSTAGNADGFHKLYVDGNLAIQHVNIDNDDRVLDTVLVGHISSVAPDLTPITFRCDCAELSQNYMGQERYTWECQGRGRVGNHYLDSKRAGTKMHLH